MDQEKVNYYANILELGYNFTLEEIKKNYYRLIKQYHPDKITDKSSKEYYEILTHFHKINEAYDFLLKHYSQISPKSYKSEEQTEKDLEAYFSNGYRFFKKGDINSALDCFMICHRRDPKNTNYIRMIVRCLMTKDRRLLEAIEYAKALLEIEPYISENYYLIGRCYYLLKNFQLALSYLKKAHSMGYNAEDIETILEQLEPKSFVKKMLTKFKKS
ncbi:MAG: DnaJ domain-containing protein [Calditerrivibrio sp.]|nr:DnaJ domain-containing protein [Calditerrivibrio sp.]